MISIVGIGNGASAIAEKFNSTSNYDVYQMSSSVARSSKRKYKLKTYANKESWKFALRKLYEGENKTYVNIYVERIVGNNP